MDATPADFSTEAASVIPATATADAASVRAQGLSLLNWRQNAEHLNGQAAFPRLAQIHWLASGIRLVVLEHGTSWAYGIPRYGAKLEQLWRTGQQAWAKLVSHTKVQIVPGSSYYIYQDAPTVVSGIILTKANHARV